jgi:hypothetical protein
MQDVVICQSSGVHVYLQCGREAMWSVGLMPMCLETSYYHVHIRHYFIVKMEEWVSLKHTVKT